MSENNNDLKEPLNKNFREPKIRFSEFSDGWKKYPLSVISIRLDNQRIPVAENLRIHGEIPYYGANGIQDYVKGFTHSGENILIAEDGANDIKNYPVKYVQGNIWVNNHAHVLKGNPNFVSTQFLSYVLKSYDFSSLLVGGSRYKLNAETLMSINLFIPGGKEQNKISEFLDVLDNTSEILQKKLLALKKYKEGILAKILGPLIQDEKKTQLDKLCSITTGKLDANAMESGGKYKFFTCSRDDYYINTYAFDTEALIISGNGEVGQCKYYNGKFNAYQRNYVLYNFNVQPLFIKYCFDFQIKSVIAKETNKSAMPYIKKDMFSKIYIPILGENNINLIIDEISIVENLETNLENRLHLLGKMKAYLLMNMFI